MKALLTLLVLGLPWMVSGGQTVAVSAGGELTVFSVTETQLTEIQRLDMNGASGPMCLSPNRKLLYVTTRLDSDGPALATFSIQSDGRLKHIHTAGSGWSGGYLRTDATGKYMAANNYRIGKVGIWGLADDGVYRGAAPQDFTLEPKAHSAVFSKDNRFLYVPATGPNKVFQLKFDDETGALRFNEPASAAGPSVDGDAYHPRHLVLHPTKDMAYTSQESKMPGAAVWQLDREGGTLELIQNIVSIEGDGVKMSTADLHLSVDGQYLFVSNRDGLNKKKPQGRDSITVFRVDSNTGRLSLVQRFSCERIPRSFAVGLSGRLLFVGGQGDSKLGVYEIAPTSGHLKKLATHSLPGSVRWVSALPTGN